MTSLPGPASGRLGGEGSPALATSALPDDAQCAIREDLLELIPLTPHLNLSQT